MSTFLSSSSTITAPPVRQDEVARAADNPYLWADEARRFMTAAGRHQRSPIAWTSSGLEPPSSPPPSPTSLIPPLGTDNQSADSQPPQPDDFPHRQACVKLPTFSEKADHQTSWGYSAGKRNVNYSGLRSTSSNLRLRSLDHECVLVHAERGFRRVKLPPLEPNGTVAKWYLRWPRFAEA